MRGAGSVLFVGILLMVAGVLNIIYGIAAVGDSHFYAADTTFVFSSLHTWGWITIILGVIQLTASLSLFGGGAYGRVIGLVAASLGAIGALLDIGSSPLVVDRGVRRLRDLHPWSGGVWRAGERLNGRADGGEVGVWPPR
jgi:hypothetical protein